MGLCGVRADMMRSAWAGGTECVRGWCGVRKNIGTGTCFTRTSFPLGILLFCLIYNRAVFEVFLHPTL